MVPTRLSVMTLNLWRDERWAEREPAVERCLETFRPDLLCLQELTPATRDRLDETLADYDRVEAAFPGWETEGNIYWHADRFHAIEYGTEDVGCLADHRRLFWVRLGVAAPGEPTMVASTAHFTAPNHPEERDTGRSPRVEQSRRTARALDRLAGDDEPTLFAGDLNDATHPRRILGDAGYTDTFTELNLPVPPTFPARPTRGSVATTADQPLDWIFADDGADARSATVPRFSHDGVAPSDHWPVVAVYEVE
jgi:endonuclease/exonuclease/phosphatase family metal-dependent hydrolase